MSDYTIAEFGELPSKGKIYKKNVNPTVHLRTMTTEEEMRRLSHTEYQYKVLCSIIDDCLIEPIGISSYDMHLGDYQYLLHRLRVVTYGSEYPSTSLCPICGRVNKNVLNLDEIKTIDFNEQEFEELLNLELPVSGRKLRLRFPTPRDLDEISKEEKEFQLANPDNEVNINYLLQLKHTIDTVDGQHLDPVKLDVFLRKLVMKDTNLIYQTMLKINEKVGIDIHVDNVCTNPKCGARYATTFRITNEFFGPTIQ